MGASGTDNFCLRWNDFAENVSGAFKELRSESDFFDVTLACTDSGSRTLQAHKVILSACSNFFKSTFRQQTHANKHPSPYIYLRGVTYNDLTSILDFIYNGEVNVAQEELNSFLAVAEELQIKGLTNRDSNSSSTNNASESSPSSSATPRKQSHPGAHPGHPRPRSAQGQDHPPVKKIRRSSPAPTASTPSVSKVAQQPIVPIEVEPEEVKEVVNIKDDPEVLGLASTSAVNPDEAGQEFGGEDYDESYDGYYEDDGAEMGEGAEGTDGTKALVRTPDFATYDFVQHNHPAASGSNPQTGGHGSSGAKIQKLKPKTDRDSTSKLTNQERYAHLIKLEDGKVRCALCNSVYSCLVSARAHTIRVHEHPEYFECCFCKRIFRTKLNFRSHLNLSHGIKGSNLVAQYGKLVDVNAFEQNIEDFGIEADVIIEQPQ